MAKNKHNRKVKTTIYAIKQKEDNKTIGYIKTYSDAQMFLNSQYNRKTKQCAFYAEATNFEKAFRSNVKLEEIIDPKELEVKAEVKE